MIKPEIEDFIGIYNKRADQIYRYCYFRVYSESLAEELTQETFMRAWQYLQNDRRQISNLSAFLYQICRNLITDYYRKRKVRFGGEESLDYLLAMRGNSAEPAYDGKRVVETRISAAETMQLMLRLPRAEREILILRYVENMPPREIAKILKTNPKKISTRINRALKKLKEHSLHPAA